MHSRSRTVYVLLGLILALGLSWAPRLRGGESKATKIEWVGWSEDLFTRAKKENKFVILDLEAVWCHWCHVMEEKTYSDPKVIKLISEKYIAVRVDQDSRPDLSNRYEDYGWPATIFYSPTGQELVKRSGFFPPQAMVALLQACIDDPTPGPSVKAPPALVFESPFLTPAARTEMRKTYLEGYDHKNGGWGFVHKFLPADTVEFAILEARGGDKASEKMAKQTLKLQPKLLDPAWGGMYQYSTGGIWTEPHFEKIMTVQADSLRIYSAAYAQWKDPKYLATAKAVAKYLETFLTSPEGAFYVSQDADLVQGQHSDAYFKLGDAARRAKGIPRVDQHQYSRENGWAIGGLLDLYAVTGDQKFLTAAQKSADWVVKNRAITGGGFRHDADDQGRLYLADTLNMGVAFLKLYATTADRQWVQKAKDAADFIQKNFSYTNDQGKVGGYVTTKMTGALAARPQKDENISIARFTNLLHQYTGDAAHRKIAEQAMLYLSVPAIAQVGPPAGILLADRELGTAPLHLTIVGPKSDAAGKALFAGALAYPVQYKRVEWWDRQEGPLPRMDVSYPELPRPAAFVCTNQRCSLPIFKAEELRAKIDRVIGSTNEGT